DRASDVLEHLPVESDAVELSQTGERIYLIIKRHRPDIVRALRSEQQRFAALAHQIAPPPVCPEAVPAVVAEAAERLAQIVRGGASAEQVALGARSEERR